MNRYAEQIKKLDFIIENWELIKIKPSIAYCKFFDEFGGNLNFLHGLCRNCDLEYLPIYIQDSMFMSFPKYSGNCLYPLSTYPKMVNCFTDTPERLELAKHCSKYLNNLVASIEKSGTI